MLLADNIAIRFGNECVLDRFSCHINRGDFVCITGRSGCGKTSLLKAFLGLTPLTAGEIRVGEYVLSEQTCSAIRRNVVYLPQDLALPYETVDEAVKQVLRIGGAKPSQLLSDALADTLVKLGLDEEMLGKRMVEISGGQRQRLMLAVLSLLDREVWLLDEPTAALDAASRNYVIAFLIEQQRQGKTIVAVSHDAYFSSLCSRTVKMD